MVSISVQQLIIKGSCGNSMKRGTCEGPHAATKQLEIMYFSSAGVRDDLNECEDE